jgi:CspA family cold shock protein
MAEVNGTVKWFNDAKGYGFITDNTGKDYFVHYSNVVMDGRKTLLKGAKVTFVPVDNKRGSLAAVEVKVL